MNNDIAKEAAEADLYEGVKMMPFETRWFQSKGLAEALGYKVTKTYIETARFTRASSADKDRMTMLEEDIQAARDRDSYRENLVQDLKSERASLRTQLSEAQQEIARLTGLLNGNPEEANE